MLRALLISKRLHMDAVGYGSADTWYFSLNAILREFIEFFHMTRKRQLVVLCVLLAPLWLTELAGVIHWITPASAVSQSGASSTHSTSNCRLRVMTTNAMNSRSIALSEKYHVAAEP